MSSFAEHEAEQAAITARYDALSKIGTLAHNYGAEIEICEDESAALAYLGDYIDQMSPGDLAIYDEARADANEDVAAAMSVIIPAHGGGDPENMNDDRAEWASIALGQFMITTGTDPEDALADLLCDLMHMAHRDGQDFATELSRAFGHFEAETMSGDGEENDAFGRREQCETLGQKRGES